MNHTLHIKYGTSRGQDTYGYTLVTLREHGKVKARTCGGGYDMRGTVFADWLAKEYQPELLAIKEQFQAQWDKVKGYNTFKEKPLYGGCLNTNEKGRDYITLDGGCGYESIVRIANAIGLNVSRIDAGRNLDVLLVSMKQVETCAI